MHLSAPTINLTLPSVYNNWYNDGVEWHDAACYRTKQFVCEDSEKMINFLRRRRPNAVV